MATDVQYIVRQDGDRWAVVLQAGRPYGGVQDGLATDGFMVEQERVVAHRRTQQAAHDLAARLQASHGPAA
jgi:hypothetical protein